ncbi:DUF2851 family protein [Flavobacteriaceae bacterium]|nr:DUF2851 family protein [Flavobacteriaceae bacterium]
MKEAFLHYLWRFQKFSKKNLRTSDSKLLQVLDPGTANLGAGPDFSSAKIFMEALHWNGAIELHLLSSDWFRHGHQKDSNYDGVILHVVWENDTDVCYPNGNPIPTLQLSDFVDQKELQLYKKTFLKKPLFVPCEAFISQFPTSHWLDWQERLLAERMESRFDSIYELLKDQKNDWEAVLFILLAKGFGLNQNGAVFFTMAKQISFDKIRKLHGQPEEIEALLMGQLGLLDGEAKDVYHETLQNKFAFLKVKYQLPDSRAARVQFARLRPSNFPTVRIAQLAQLYAKKTSLFQELMHHKHIDESFKLFSVNAGAYWDKHYNFAVLSKNSPKKITADFFNLIVINTIIPIRFAYANFLGRIGEADLFEWFSKVPNERNSILKKFTDHQAPNINTGGSQALLHLYKEYCQQKKCLSCRVGFYLMKST